MRTQPPGRRGFTLLEALVAIALVGAILGVSVTLLRDVGTARERIESRMRRVEGVALVFDLLEARLATAVVTDLAGGPGIVGDASNLRVTGCGVSTARIAAEVDRSPLLDRASLALEWRAGDLAIREEDGDWSVLASDLVAIRFRYHDGEDWRETWDSTFDGLPVAVECSVWSDPWPEDLVPAWLPEPEDPLDDLDPDSIELDEDPFWADAEGFAPPPVPADEDEVPLADLRRVVALLDPVALQEADAVTDPFSSEASPAPFASDESMEVAP